MEFTTISGANLNASRIGLGTWAIGGSGWGGTDEGAAMATIRAAIDRGITFIDTAPVYGFGRAEEIIGKALYGSGQRQRVILATKAGIKWNWTRTKFSRDSSPRRLRAEIEQSLRRLRTDTIDLYQIHWPDPRTPFEETAQALATLKAQGKIRAIGVSNYTAEQMSAFRRAAPLNSNQPPYNLFEREIESGVLPYCLKEQITVIAYGALCRGLLSGRMSRETQFAKGDIRGVDPKFNPPRYDQYLKAVERLDRLAQQRYGKRVLHLAVRWLLDQPGVGIALWGARRPQQLDPLNDVLGWNIDAEAGTAIDNIIAEEVSERLGAEFMAPP
jgi:aryl-alcohol dehydrogenase-like predicted oxidoreductase